MHAESGHCPFVIQGAPIKRNNSLQEKSIVSIIIVGCVCVTACVCMIQNLNYTPAGIVSKRLHIGLSLDSYVYRILGYGTSKGYYKGTSIRNFVPISQKILAARHIHRRRGVRPTSDSRRSVIDNIHGDDGGCAVNRCPTAVMLLITPSVQHCIQRDGRFAVMQSVAGVCRRQLILI